MTRAQWEGLNNLMDVLKNEDQYIDRLEAVREAAEALVKYRSSPPPEVWATLRRALNACAQIGRKP
jgi:hypothetical protein